MKKYTDYRRESVYKMSAKNGRVQFESFAKRLCTLFPKTIFQEDYVIILKNFILPYFIKEKHNTYYIHFSTFVNLFF